MPKAILKKRLNFMNSVSNAKNIICDVPAGILVFILKTKGSSVQILFKEFTKWVNEKHIKKI